MTRTRTGTAARTVAALAVLTVLVAACQYLPEQARIVQELTLTDANELSGVVASPTHAGWYWSIRDVWKQEADPSQGLAALPSGAPDAVPSWCPPTDTATATGRNRCRRVERASLYAFRLDADQNVVEVRQFRIADESMATNPWVAENNDWEDLALGPVRTIGGTSTPTLLIAGIGDATKNPSKVESPPGSGNWQSVQCTSRRMIELPEPALDDPTWSPHRIFDLADYSSNGTNCNSESMVTTDGPSPKAVWIAKRTVPTIRSRSLDWASGRDPVTNPTPLAAPNPAAPAATVEGNVQGIPSGVTFTGVDLAPGNLMLITSTLDAESRCQAWSFRSPDTSDPVTLLTTSTPEPLLIAPTNNPVCKGGAEGVAFLRDLTNPSMQRNSFFMIRDTGTTGVLGVYIPWKTDLPADPPANG